MKQVPLKQPRLEYLIDLLYNRQDYITLCEGVLSFPLPTLPLSHTDAHWL
jgi:hypothetical protein